MSIWIISLMGSGQLNYYYYYYFIIIITIIIINYYYYLLLLLLTFVKPKPVSFSSYCS